MRWQNILSLRLRSLFRRNRVEYELDDEMRFHLERQIAANRAAGMSPEEARYAALRSFGGVEQMKEECRDARALGWLEDLVRDLRLASRTLRKAPATSAAAIAALSLGIAAVTVVFAVAHSVLWQPLPFADSERLVIIAEYPHNGSGNMPVSPADYLDYRARSHVFASMAAMQWPRRRILEFASTAKRSAVESVSASFLPTLRVSPIAGRIFTPAEADSGARVAVLTDRAWKRDFASDPSIVGKAVRFDGESYDVIGVVPYADCDMLGTPDFYVPLPIPAGASRTDQNLFVLARLGPGVTLAEANADLALTGAQLASRYPAADASFTPQADGLRHYDAGYMRPTLMMFLAAVSFLWLIVCANVANLLLAKAAGRRPEFAVRRALGARAGALVRQTTAECFVLTAIATALAFVLVPWLLAAFLRVAAAPSFSLTRLGEIGFHPPAIAFALGIAGVTVVLSAAGPTLVTLSGGMDAMQYGGRSGGHGRGERRVREGLVAVEIALALVLLAGAGLFFNSLIRLQRADLGFDARGLVTAHAAFVSTGAKDGSAVLRYHNDLLARVGSLPGVQEVGATGRLPVNGGAAVYFRRPGRPLPPGAERDWSLTSIVTPNYLSLLHIPLLRGRQFTSADDARAPRVAIVNQYLARTYFGDEDPIGQQLELETANDILDSGIAPGRIEIVGLVPTIHEVGIDEIPFPVLYMPLAQNPVRDIFLVARARDEQAVASALRNPFGGGVDHVRTLEEHIAASLVRTKFNLLLIESFAAIALLLVALGIYAVMSHAVTQQTREIGVRMALGARPEHMSGLVVRRTAVLAAAGLAAGLALAFFLAHEMRDMLYLVPHKHEGLLYRVSVHDPLTLGAACAFITAVTLLASWFPARRAARVDPMVALRYE